MPFCPTMNQVITTGFMVGAFVGLVARVQAQGSGAADPAQSKMNEPVRRDPATIQVSIVNYYAYYALGGSAKTEFEATALMLNAKGMGQVAITKEGSVSVKAQFNGLAHPSKFGNQFLTYILWAITPKGQPLKVGELSVNGDGARLGASTVLRTFGMIVTAEPYSAVTRPSNLVVLAAKPRGRHSPSLRPVSCCEMATRRPTTGRSRSIQVRATRQN